MGRDGEPEPVRIEVWFADNVPDSLASFLRSACQMLDDFHLVADPDHLEQWVGHVEVNLNRRCVVVEEIWEPRILGRYVHSRRERHEPTGGPRMEIGPGFPDIVGTMVHEFYHLIEQEMLYPGRVPVPQSAAFYFDQIVAAIRRSGAYRYSEKKAVEAQATYENFAADPATPDFELLRSKDLANHYGYVIRDSEWLARVYAQVVFERYFRHSPPPGTPSVERMPDPDEAQIRVHLSPEELPGIEKDFLRMFHALGWR